MEERDYEITYNLGNGIQVFTFVVKLALILTTVQVFTHQLFVTRTLNNGFVMKELATFTFKLIITAAGIALTLLLIQRLLVNELLTKQ